MISQIVYLLQACGFVVAVIAVGLLCLMLAHEVYFWWTHRRRT